MEDILYLISFGAIVGGFFILIAIAILIEFIINSIRGVKYEKPKVRLSKNMIAIISISLLCFIITIIPKTPLGSTQIDSLFEKSEYTEKYYVLMYPGGAKDKNYKVEADITSTIVGYESGSERKYYIEKAYFSNGGYITFYNNMDWNDLKVGEKVSILDDKDKYWDIELTKDRVNK